MVNIYQPDISQRSKENLLDLFRHTISQGEVFEEYIFQIVKQYSERHKAAFLKSNLVDFMNDLARERKKRMFGTGLLGETLSL